MLRSYPEPSASDSSTGGEAIGEDDRGAKKGAAKKRSTAKRELIDTGRNKMFAKRRADGTFKEMDDVGRSLSTDRRRTAKRTTKSGHGDQGDRPRKATKKR